MALTALAAAIWLTLPLWRKALPQTQRRRAANVAAYRQRVKEIEADTAAGLLDTDTAQTLRDELDQRLLRDAQPDPAATESSGRKRRGAIAAMLALLVVVGAAGGYWMQGSWRQQQQLVAGAAPGATPASVNEMVTKLEQRLQEDPNQVEGWALLGRSYFVMERYADAARAYARANELTQQREPDLLVNEGEALGLARERDLLGRPQALFDAALQLAPQNGKALWYAGLAAEQARDYARAKTHWSALSVQDLPEPLRQALDQKLQEVAALSGGAPVAITKPAAPPVNEFAIRIPLALKVKPQLQAGIPADATLFVFAKAENGPPMPLAVYRGKASELPRELSLDDSMSMTPALKLSQFQRWLVTARISRAGSASAQSGDVQGTLTVERAQLGGAALGLELDEIVP